ncbi:terminase large subunit, partial [Salmonella enterica subsp. enterica serovar Corvallis]|nr:terminase large subunit [Salmonella enterica subsp. enterica serovar Corvallis]
QRHFDDIKKSLDKNYPYRIDRDLAERACRFVQLLPHSSGELAGQKLKLEPWQSFAFCSIFGWVTKKDKKRRFREAYIRVARKNGKSFFAAGIGTYMFCADGENSAEVYCGATTMAQAKKVFTPARQMADRLPSLRAKFDISVWVDSLTRPDGSVFAPIAGKPGDGDSPHCAIID